MGTQMESSKCPVACSSCRIKKVKCNGATPCKSCMHHDIECQYPPPRQRAVRVGKVTSAREKNKILEERLSRMESLLQRANNAAADEPANSIVVEARQHPLSPSTISGSYQVEGSVEVPTDWNKQAQDVAVRDEAPSTFEMPITPSRDDPSEASFPPSSMPIQRNPCQPSVVNICGGQALRAPVSNDSPCSREENLISPQDSNSEFHGTISFLAVCSKPGIDWIVKQTQSPDFIGIATDLSLNITRRLNLNQNVCRNGAPEPAPEVAWAYCNAYFDESPDTAYGIVDRASFHARLHAHFQNDPNPDPDSPWFALRNIIYAYGCRIILSKEQDPRALLKSEAQAWRYFENALSVHVELMYTRSGLPAIQALLLMAFYVEGVETPTINYMLLSTAMRLAQSKGLHLQAPAAWKLQESEIVNRSWLFWGIYFLEKQIASRSGRPSTIDDNDISCPLPTTIPEGSSINLAFFTSAIKHARILSAIGKRLSTVDSQRLSVTDTITIIREFERELEQWKDSMPSSLRLGMPVKVVEVPLKWHLEHIIYLHFAYYGSLITMHSIFAYPWNLPDFHGDIGAQVASQVTLSSNVVAEASRNIVLITKEVEIKASSPSWLIIYFPLVAAINLFIYVLKYPTLPTVQSDIALMDVLAGHFSYMEFLSSTERSFAASRELASLARAVVKKAREYQVESPSMQMTRQSSGYMDPFSFNELQNIDMENFGVDDWPILPFFSHLP